MLNYYINLNLKIDIVYRFILCDWQVSKMLRMWKEELEESSSVMDCLQQLAKACDKARRQDLRDQIINMFQQKRKTLYYLPGILTIYIGLSEYTIISLYKIQFSSAFPFLLLYHNVLKNSALRGCKNLFV